MKAVTEKALQTPSRSIYAEFPQLDPTMSPAIGCSLPITQVTLGVPVRTHAFRSAPYRPSASSSVWGLSAFAITFGRLRRARPAAASEKEAKGKEPFSNKIRIFFGQIYALLTLPLGGAGNFVRVEQGSVGAVLRFGKFDRMLQPGRHQFNVFVEKVVVVPLMKISCLDVKPQMVMTKDNLTVTIDAVCFYRVLDATKVLFEVANYQKALSNLVQVTMRTVVGENSLGEIFAQRPRLNARITELIEVATGPWGIQVSQVELKEVQIQQSMQRALAAVAEAQQEAEAKLIQARAQRESAGILAEASQDAFACKSSACLNGQARAQLELRTGYGARSCCTSASMV
ncbi:unnamed protein product [Effrenium voratum]|nr:unnamed protein product [Effrenium voratum]